MERKLIIIAMEVILIAPIAVAVMILEGLFPNIDKGGLRSLAATIWSMISLLLLKSYFQNKGLREFIKEFFWFPTPSLVIMFVLLGAATVGMWLAIRKISLLAEFYLMREGYGYTYFDVLDVVAYVLAIRLCFTLFETIKEKERSRSILGMVDTGIQAFLISIIVLLPKYELFVGSNMVFSGGYLGFVSLLGILIIAVVALILVRKWARESYTEN